MAGLLGLLRTRAPPAPSTEAATTSFGARPEAVEAVERALAAAPHPELRPEPHGRRIPPGTADYTVEVVGEDTLSPAPPQLPVSPITLIASDYALRHGRTIAASSAHICYGLKQGHVRVLSRASPVRALLKGHRLPIADLAFAPTPADGLLASGGRDGQLCVWRLALTPAGDALEEEAVLRASFQGAEDVLLAWRSDAQVAAGAAGRVLLLDVATGCPGQELQIDAGGGSLPAGVAALPDWRAGEAVTALTSSPYGELLAAGGAEGTLRIWRLPAAGSAPAWTSTVPSGAAEVVGALLFLPCAGGALLLAGNANNTVLELWHADDLAAAPAWTRLQIIRLGGGGSKPSQGDFNHVDVVPEQQLVLVADTPRKAVFTLHYSGGGQCCSACFASSAPPLQCGRWVSGACPLRLQRCISAKRTFCSQPGPLPILPTSPGEGAAMRFDHAAQFGVAVPILSFTALWAPDAEPPAVELNCVQTTAVQQYSLDPEACRPAEGGGEAVGEAAGQEIEGGAATDAQEEPKPAQEAPEGLACEPTLGAIANGDDAAAKEAPATAALPPIMPSGLGDASVTASEGCPSPPPTPHDVGLSGLGPGVPPPPGAAPLPHLPPPPAALLGAGVDSLAAALAASPATPPSPARPGELATAEQPAVAAEPVVVTAAATAPPAEAPEGLAGVVGAAVAEQLASMHKKFAGHVSLMYRELLKAMKAEVAAQLAAQQAATAQAIAAALAAQKAQVEAERASLLAEERANMQALLAAISSTLNNDLPLRLQDALRAELNGLSAGLAAAAAPAVQQALAAALPKEVSAAVRLGMERQLTALQTALERPLAESFRAAFGAQLLPAFEAATQTLFGQVNSTLAGGLREYTAASRAALSEPRQLATQLQEALGRAERLAASAAAAATAGSTPAAVAPLPPLRDPRAELSALLAAQRYEEAFSSALGRQDVGVVAWLCSQLEPSAVLLGLSPPVLLALVQQLAADLGSRADLHARLEWIREAALALDPAAPLVAPHIRPVLGQVLAQLQAAAALAPPGEQSSCKLAMHVVRSQLAG